MFGGLKTGQVTVDTTSGGVLIAAERPGRGSITIINKGTTAIYLGVSGLTTSTGLLLAGVVGASITLSTQAAIYGISAGSQAVSYAEVY